MFFKKRDQRGYRSNRDLGKPNVQLPSLFPVTPQPNPTSSSPSDRFYRFAWFLVLFGFTTLWMGIAPDYGMSWDTVTRWNSGDTKLAYYQGLLSDRSERLSPPMDDYPGLYDLPLAWIAAHFDIDRFELGKRWAVVFAVFALVGTGWLGCQVGGWKHPPLPIFTDFLTHIL